MSPETLCKTSCPDLPAFLGVSFVGSQSKKLPLPRSGYTTEPRVAQRTLGWWQRITAYAESVTQKLVRSHNAYGSFRGIQKKNEENCIC